MTTKMEVIKIVKRERISEIDKQWHNLTTLLKYSNATPFKERTDAGFTCVYCFRTYRDADVFRLHTNEEHNREKFTYKAGTGMSNFVIFLDILDLKCTICDTFVETIKGLTEHLSTVHDKKFYLGLPDYFQPYILTNDQETKCYLCEQSFTSLKQLTQHMNGHSRNYICSICGDGFVNSFRLFKHEMRHSKKTSYPCKICGQVFTALSQKIAHWTKEHKGIAGYCQCQICKARFKNYYQKRRHMEEFHNAEAFKCEYCGKLFSLKNNMLIHQRSVHLKEKPYECSDCFMRFSAKNHMLDHYVQLHTNKRKFMCEFCGLAFATLSYRNRHIKKHHNVSKQLQEWSE